MPVNIYKLITFVAKRLGIKYNADYWQNAAEAALRAMPRYDSAKGSVSTFLVPRIRGALLDCVNSRARDKARPSVMAIMVPLTDMAEPSTDLTPIDSLAATEASQAIAEVMERLSWQTRNVLDCLYNLDLTYDTTGEVLGMCRTTVFEHHRKAIGVLRSSLAA